MKYEERLKKILKTDDPFWVVTINKFIEENYDDTEMGIADIEALAKNEERFNEFTQKLVQNHNNTKVVKEEFFKNINRSISEEEKEKILKRIDEKIDDLVDNGSKPTNLFYNVDRIRTYLKTKGLSDVVVSNLIKKYYNHPDIAEEFEYYIRTSKFVEEKPIMESGYTAKRLYEDYRDKLDISGAFSMLITLRENPERGLKIIADNFSTK